MMLESKSVLVFAASGAIGSGVARACAREGAHVWLSGRNASTLEALASSTEADGVKATPDVVDALDQAAVETYVNRVVETVGGIDAVFNAIGLSPAELGYPAPSTTQDLEMFLEPARVIVGSTFVTARVAAVPMMRRGHGSIVTLCATLSGIAAPYMAGISAACGRVRPCGRQGQLRAGQRDVRDAHHQGDQRRTGPPPGDKPDEMQLPSTALGHPITVAEVAGHRRFPRLRRVERDDRPGRHRRRRRPWFDAAFLADTGEGREGQPVAGRRGRPESASASPSANARAVDPSSSP